MKNKVGIIWAVLACVAAAAVIGMLSIKMFGPAEESSKPQKVVVPEGATKPPPTVHLPADYKAVESAN